MSSRSICCCAPSLGPRSPRPRPTAQRSRGRGRGHVKPATDGTQMFTQFLGTTATVYGVLAAVKSLLQTRQMLARRSSRDVSAGFLASYTGGYAIWLAYGLSTGSLPLIVVDTVGLLCAGLTIAVALSLRGSLIRRVTWSSRDTTSDSHRPAAPDPQPSGARWTASARHTA